MALQEELPHVVQHNVHNMRGVDNIAPPSLGARFAHSVDDFLTDETLTTVLLLSMSIVTQVNRESVRARAQLGTTLCPERKSGSRRRCTTHIKRINSQQNLCRLRQLTNIT